MIRIEGTIDIQRPVAEVYDYVVNVENAPKWQPAVIEVRKLTEGPIRVGTKFNEVAKIMGRRVRTTCEITELVPDKAITFKGSSEGPLEYQTTYQFESTGATTRLKIVGDFHVKGLWRLLEPIIKGEVKKESLQELATMKKAIEERSR